jgi:Cu+-exporting ATPase
MPGREAKLFSHKYFHIKPADNKIKNRCFHCGEECGYAIRLDEKTFCCDGCRQVYLLLDETGLCGYYGLDGAPGLKAKGKFTGSRFAYLDDNNMLSMLASFRSDKQVNISFSLPQVHCASCIYLLEKLHRIEKGILSSTVNFQRKQLFLSYDPSLISLRKVVELLAFIGYEPSLSLKDSITGGKKDDPLIANNSLKKKQLTRIGVAGFCFANIMMLSFPEYLSAGNVEPGLKETFSWLNLLLSLPVLFYCASGFFLSAFKGFRQQLVNIDAPIALASTITFGLSYYQIISGKGAGYLDSGSGIIFFMLVGRWFQDKTYEALSFDRDYLSYLPLSVTTVTGQSKNGLLSRNEKSIPVHQLKNGDHILIRNGEIIPADARLLDGPANIDYSFVNGESTPVPKKINDLIYAGGKQDGPAILLQVEKVASQSYITELWNNDIFRKDKKETASYIHPWSRYFTLALFSIATGAVVYWAIYNPANIITALVSVLIVACPCSLLLSATFTYGNMLRIFGRNHFYLKNAQVIERLSKTDTIVFDKTGTLTQPDKSVVKYTGVPLSRHEKDMLRGISLQTTHPFGKLLAAEMGLEPEILITVNEFREYSGLGVEGIINDKRIRVGTGHFIIGKAEPGKHKGTAIGVEIENRYKGCFRISNHYREGIEQVVKELNQDGYRLHILSGDHDGEKINLESIFGKEATLQFAQLPAEKLMYIKNLQNAGNKVLMVGDGLNDAGALMQADTGIAINMNDSQFSPASDAILRADSFNKLGLFLQFARTVKKIITASFILSIVYNVIGISFAASATLSPLVAAILMPASSISIISFTSIASSIAAKKYKL